MKNKRSSAYVTFCCPHHGALDEHVEYVSTNIGSKRLINLPVMFCRECKEYYTPFHNLLAFTKIKYKGKSINRSQGHVEKSFPRVEVRAPRFIENTHKTEIKEIAIPPSEPRMKSTSSYISAVKEQPMKYALNAKLYLFNVKPGRHKELDKNSQTYGVTYGICPFCSSIMRAECIAMPTYIEEDDLKMSTTMDGKYCQQCRKAYIRKNAVAEALLDLNIKAKNYTIRFENVIVSGNTSTPECVVTETSNNSWNIYYPEYDIIKERNSSETMILNEQSFLGSMGYSVGKSTRVRQRLLSEAIKEYGKKRVREHIEFLIATRKGQFNGEKKYANAIRIWETDLLYISKIEDGLL